MITEHDLQEAIAECIGQRNPTASTCIKLAAFYTIKNELYPYNKEQPDTLGYSFETRETGPKIAYTGDSEFAGIVNGMDIDDVMTIMDELMTSLEIVEPRLYAAVIRKLKD